MLKTTPSCILNLNAVGGGEQVQDKEKVDRGCLFFLHTVENQGGRKPPKAETLIHEWLNKEDHQVMLQRFIITNQTPYRLHESPTMETKLPGIEERYHT
mgnify:CR=1 FL=1